MDFDWRYDQGAREQSREPSREPSVEQSYESEREELAGSRRVRSEGRPEEEHDDHQGRPEEEHDDHQGRPGEGVRYAGESYDDDSHGESGDDGGSADAPWAELGGDRRDCARGPARGDAEFVDEDAKEDAGGYYAEDEAVAEALGALSDVVAGWPDDPAALFDCYASAGVGARRALAHEDFAELLLDALASEGLEAPPSILAAAADAADASGSGVISFEDFCAVAGVEVDGGR